MTRLAVTLHDEDGPRHAGVAIDRVVIAGWTGRDEAAVRDHIAELALLGVKPPQSVPVFYRAAASRVTCADRIECLGDASGGEAEWVLLGAERRLWVGVGSDHTDRAAEAYGIAASKQMCDKPVASEFWPLTSVAGHWDQLVLRAWADGVPYQEGAVSALVDPMALLAAAGGLVDGGILFGGTLPAIGAIRPARRFAMALEDPVLGRTLRHEYAVEVLPVAG